MGEVYRNILNARLRLTSREKQLPKLFCKKAVVKNFAKLTKKSVPESL